MATPKATSVAQVAAHQTASGSTPASPAARSVIRSGALAYPPLARLFGPDGDNDWEDGNLPFVREDEDGRTCYWVEPHFDSRDEEENLAAQGDFGKRAAAVYFIHVMRHGSRDVGLVSIAQDMPKPLSYAAQNFFHYIQRLLWHHGQHVSAVQIADDVELKIAEDRRLVDCDQQITDIEALI